MNLNESKNILEAILFASPEPLSFKKIAGIIDVTEKDVKNLIDILSEEYETDSRGIKLYFFNNKVQLGINPKYNDYLKKLMRKSKNRGLSDAAMEVLSIIAYKQPITKGEIEYVRGINCDRLVNILVERFLVEEKGKLDKIGRPKTYGTTDIFLRNFKLHTLRDLPEIDYEEIEV